MKIKIKNFVFAGFAAAMFAGAAYAEPVSTTPQQYDLDNEHNLNYVTSKKYVDRVVTNANAATTALAGRVSEAEADIDDLETNAEMKSNKADNLADVTSASDLANKYPNVGAVKNALADKQDTISDLDTIRSGAAAGATAVQPSGLATINSNIQFLQMNKQDKVDSTVADGTYNIITQGTGVGANLQALDSKIGAVPANSTVMAEIAAAQTAATYNDTEVRGLISNNTAAITTINNSAPMQSGITSTKVNNYDAHIENGDIHVTAAQKAEWSGKQDALTSAQQSAVDSGITSSKVSTYDAYATNKQDKSDSTVANGTYNYITQGSGVATNLVNLDTQVKSNADAIATKASSSDLTTLVGRVTTAESNISLKQNEADSNVAQAGNYIAAGHGVASNLTALDTQVKTNADAIAGNTNAITTLQGQAANISGKQDKSTANYQMGNSSGTWTAMTTEQQNALNSGIFATTCDGNTPCVFVNNQWVPIQQ